MTHRWLRPGHAALLLALALGPLEAGWAGSPAAPAPPGDSTDAVLQRLENALREAPALASPAPPRPAVSPAARLDYYGLQPGKSTRVDVDLLLGDPTGTGEDVVPYAAPDGASDAERVEVVFLAGTRVLHRLDVVLKRPLAPGAVSALGGRRILVERDGQGWAWEYRLPGFVGLGHKDGPAEGPAAVERLRYVSPQYLADRFLARGRRAEKDGRLDDALTEYEKATRVDSGYAASYYEMGRLHEARREPAKALLHYTAAAQAAYPSRIKADAHQAIGRIYHEDHQAELAQKALGRAIAEDPTHAVAHFWLGLTYQNLLKKPDDALAAYRKAVALKPDHAAAHSNMGLIHLDRKDPRAAAAAFQKAAEASPAWAKASHRLMAARLDMGDFAGLEQEARRRLGVDATDTLAMVHLAAALSAQLPERPALVALLTPLDAEDPRLREALDWLDRAVAGGYTDRRMLEESASLRPARDRAPFAFKKIVAKLPKPRG